MITSTKIDQGVYFQWMEFGKESIILYNPLAHKLSMPFQTLLQGLI